MRVLLIAALCTFAFKTTSPCQSTPELKPRIVLPVDIKWQDDGGGFFHAAMFGKIDNPGLYMFLNKAQDGATLPPHWHSTIDFRISRHLKDVSRFKLQRHPMN